MECDYPAFRLEHRNGGGKVGAFVADFLRRSFTIVNTKK